MTLKTCLRCDWQGETEEPACPNCGVQPLYVVGASPSSGAGGSPRDHPKERSRGAANSRGVTPPPTPSPQSNPSPTDAVEPTGRSTRSAVAFVVAALVLTVSLGTWLKAHEERSAEGASTDAAANEGSAGDDSPTPVVSSSLGSLVRIDATTGEILARVPIRRPTQVATDGRSVWVLSGGTFGGSALFQVEAATNAIKGVSDPGLLGIAPNQLAVAGGSAWLGNDAGQAYRFAPGAITGEATRFKVKSPGFLWPVAAAGSLWVSCCRLPPALLRVDPATGRVLARIERVGRVVASGTGFLWALDRDEGPRLVRIDTETHETVPIGALGFLWTDLTVADGAVWASSREDDAIVRLDPFTGNEIERIRVGGTRGELGAIAAGAGAVWATIGATGTVARYDIETGQIDMIDVGGPPNGLVFAHDSVWVAVTDGSPAEAKPGVAVLDQAFADAINGCERLVVTRPEVKAALGFRTEDPAPTRSADGAFFGCKYAASFDMRQGGGQVVITAYTGGGPPISLDRSRSVQGIGDEAEFTPFGNADGHVDGPEGATSMLRVRSGDHVLHFNGGVFDPAERSWAPYGLPALRQLAEYALSTLATEVRPGVLEAASEPFFLDLRTGKTTPVAKSLAGGINFAASLDSSRLAYVGIGGEGSPQIFIAHLDGTGIRQMTHDPAGAAWPALSPDGTMIAYLGKFGDLFVLDVATGEATRITDETHGGQPQFTPNGSSLIFTGGGNSSPELRIVPVAGGKSTLVIGLGDGLTDSGNGSLSPDGSLLIFRGGGSFESGHCGPCQFVAKADGTEMRVFLPYCGWNPAGTWSPDGGRIVCSKGNGITIVDIATGEASRVAEGSGAIWLDLHTLLVEA